MYLSNTSFLGCVCVYIILLLPFTGLADCVLALGFEKMEKGSLSSKVKERKLGLGCLLTKVRES